MKTKTKQTTSIILSLIFAGIISSCSSLVPYKACVDCSQFPLVYQGTITEYTQGVYIETACITIDLAKFSGEENFEIGDIIYLEYVIKQGEFCSEDDESVYSLYTVKNDKDSEIPAEMTGTGDGIKIKDMLIR
ncbi:MAG TPA: hypothetical protein VK004_06905 [Ignavibacteria bacterium]|nr:hypothetical protein [Ignavibacteria bacterium]